MELDGPAEGLGVVDLGPETEKARNKVRASVAEMFALIMSERDGRRWVTTRSEPEP